MASVFPDTYEPDPVQDEQICTDPNALDISLVLNSKSYAGYEMRAMRECIRMAVRAVRNGLSDLNISESSQDYVVEEFEFDIRNSKDGVMVSIQLPLNRPTSD